VDQADVGWRVASQFEFLQWDLRPEVLSQNRLLRSRNSVKTATGPAMPKFAWILGLSARRNGLVAKARGKRLREAGAAALRKHLDAQPGKILRVLTERGGIGHAEDFTWVRVGDVPPAQ
jgi:hypothetical protein